MNETGRTHTWYVMAAAGPAGPAGPAARLTGRPRRLTRLAGRPPGCPRQATGFPRRVTWRFRPAAGFLARATRGCPRSAPGPACRPAAGRPCRSAAGHPPTGPARRSRAADGCPPRSPTSSSRTASGKPAGRARPTAGCCAPTGVLPAQCPGLTGGRLGGSAGWWRLTTRAGRPARAGAGGRRLAGCRGRCSAGCRRLGGRWRWPPRPAR